ncbi:MAG: sigma-54-dependent Fis family transcriptional regulator, partial [Gammaproteobacteria bacterium]|nr:sigma-54-dependent Fis family transcriptional regulator [Gammaproteobacteria bacterium]
LRMVEELIKINISLSTERDLHHLLDMIVTTARDLTGTEVGRVYLFDQTKRQLHLEISQNEQLAGPGADLSPLPLMLEDGPNTHEVCAYCAFTGNLINVPDVYSYSGFDFSRVYEYDRVSGYHTRSMLVLPLRGYEESSIGVLQLINRRDPETGHDLGFDQSMERLVAAFASQVAVAVDNVQLIEQKHCLIDVLNNTNKVLEKENRQLRERIGNGIETDEIIGECPKMLQVFSLLEKVVNSDVIVLIRGETGTGKELIAHAIHRNSPRLDQAFVVQNCAALPENLLESELFGYRRGAFSGAYADKKGLFELADGGTLFLDEIGDLSLGLQGKLLRVLQDREVRPLGGLESRKIDVRVIAATHQPLEAMIQNGAFREDLYYRLVVFPIDLPPLRERKEDLPALLHHFLDRFSKRYGKSLKGYSPAALERLLAYEYPGNIRELRNAVERSTLLAETKGSIMPEHLSVDLINATESMPVRKVQPSGGNLKEIVSHYEAEIIRQHLRANNWNQTRTALTLGISRRSLVDKIGRFQISRGGSSSH